MCRVSSSGPQPILYHSLPFSQPLEADLNGLHQWTPMTSGFQLDSADGKSQEETGGTEKGGARELIYLVHLCEVSPALLCPLTEGHQATCSTWLYLIPSSSKLFFLFFETRGGDSLASVNSCISLTVSFVISPCINKPSRITLICVCHLFPSGSLTFIDHQLGFHSSK